MVYLAIALAVFIVSTFSFMYFLGAFYKVKFEEKEVGPFKIVYNSHKGDYSQIGPVMDKIYKQLLDEGIETTKGIGIYYDNPGKVPMAQLRSEGGCIVEEADYSKLENSVKGEDGSVKGKIFNIKDIEKEVCITTEFPYKSKMSILFGVFKVYPELGKYTKEKKYEYGPVTEIYDKPNKKIIYAMKIDNSLRS